MFDKNLWALIELKPFVFLFTNGGGEKRDKAAPVKYPAFTTLDIFL